MTIGNFDWTMHALLFLHTKRVITRQKKKLQAEEDMEGEENEENAGVEIDREP